MSASKTSVKSVSEDSSRLSNGLECLFPDTYAHFISLSVPVAGVSSLHKLTTTHHHLTSLLSSGFPSTITILNSTPRTQRHSMATTPQHSSGIVVLKLSKRGIRRLNRAGVQTLSGAHNTQLEMQDQKVPRTREQKRRFVDPTEAEAAAPNYYESSPSFSPPPKRRVVRRRRFFVDDGEEEEGEKSEVKEPLTPSSNSTLSEPDWSVLEGRKTSKTPETR